MSKEELMKRMIELQGPKDTEIMHVEADKILCEALRELGYEELVDEWDKVFKWYS